MKFSLVVTLVVVLAIAHGTESGSLVKRDVPSEVDSIVKLIHYISATHISTFQDMVEKVRAHELTSKAQLYIEDSKAQIQPLNKKVQMEAEKLQVPLKPYIANIKEQVKSLTDSFQARVMSLVDNFHAQVTPLTGNIQTHIDELFKQVMK